MGIATIVFLVLIATQEVANNKLKNICPFFDYKLKKFNKNANEKILKIF
jgi:hypothetical protein